MILKDRYKLTELVITFLMISLSFVLLDFRLFPLQNFAIFGFFGSFLLSWTLRNKKTKILTLLINSTVFCVFVWALYTCFQTAFSLKETITICIKSILLVVFLLSLNCFYRLNISYIQLLLIPVFISLLIFGYKFSILTKIAVVIYCICWLIILRVKFVSSLPVFQTNLFKKRIILYNLAVIAGISLILSWILSFSSINQEKYIKVRNTAAGFSANELLIEKTAGDFYDLQENINRETIEIISEVNSIKKKKILLTLLNSFIAEFSEMELLEENQNNLSEYLSGLKQELQKFDIGLLIQKISELTEKRVMMNFYKATQDLTDEFHNEPFRLRERISGLSLINQMKYADDYPRCRLLDKKIKYLIRESGIAEESKFKLELLSSRLKDWKEYLIYLNESGLIKNKIRSEKKELRQRLQQLLDEVNKIQDLSMFLDVENRLNKELASAEGQEIVNQLIKLSVERLELVAIDMGNKLMDKTADFTRNSQEIVLGKSSIDKIKNSNDPDSFLKESEKFIETYKNSASTDFQGSFREFLETKSVFFNKNLLILISAELNKSLLPDKGIFFFNRITQSFDKTASLESLKHEKKQILNEISKFNRQGLISAEGTEVLTNSITEAFKLFEFTNFTFFWASQTSDISIPAEVKTETKEQTSAFTSNQSMNEDLTRIIKEMNKSNSIERLSDLFNGAQSIIKKIESQGVEKSFIDSVHNNLNRIYSVRKNLILEQTFKSIRGKIENIRLVDPQKACNLETDFETIKQNIAAEKIVSGMKALSETLSGLVNEEKEFTKNKNSERANIAFHVYARPSVGVLAVNSRTNLKAILAQENMVKEVQDEVDWVCFNPNTAYVDNAGIVYAVSEGTTEITAVFRGIAFEKIKIFVCKGIEEKIKKEIENSVNLHKNSYSQIDYGNEKILIAKDKNIAIKDYGIPEAVSENIWYYGGKVHSFMYFSDEISLILVPGKLSVNLNSPFEFKVYANISGVKLEDVSDKARFLINEPSSISITEGNIITAKQEGSFVIMAQYLDKFSNPCFLEIKKSHLNDKIPESISIIEVLPHKPKVPLNSSLNFIALGVFQGGEPGGSLVKDISHEAKWFLTENGTTLQEKNNNITFRNPGVSRVKCVYQAIESYEQQVKVSDDLNKTETRLNYITILPEFCANYVGSLISLKAFGTYSDNSVEEITDLVDWKLQSVGTLKQTGNGDFLLKKPGISEVWCQLHDVVSFKAKVTSLSKIRTSVFNQEKEFFGKQKTDLVKEINSGTDKLADSFINREVSGLRIVPDNLEFNLGETRSVCAFATYSDGKEEDVTLLGDWISSNDDVLTVNFGEIRAVSVGVSTVSFNFRGKYSTQVTALVKSPVLRSISVLPVSIEMPFGSKRKFEAIGYYSDNLRLDITSLVNWKIENPVCVKINGAVISPIAINKTKIYAEYSGIKSLPVNIRVFPDTSFIIGIFMEFFFSVIGVLLIVLFCFVAIASNKTRKLRKILNNNPRNFVLALNNNLIKILSVYGINNDACVLPMEFATLVESKLRINNGIFVNMTKKVQEVKFSTHAFTYKNALDFIALYDEFIQILCGSTGKLSFLRNYLRALLLGIKIRQFM